MSQADETAKAILAEVADSRRWAEAAQPNELFLAWENIIANLAFLVGPLMEAEQAYRVKVQFFINEGKSVAGAKAQAKSEDEYIYWRKLQLAYELGQDQVMLLKKFSDKLQEEYRRS
jgi:hypothetical protein